MQKTYQPKHKDIKRNWHFVDLKGKILGRTATQIATYLMGKHKTTYSTHMDMGDYVVAVNAKEIAVTGNKETQKVYQSHSGYPGGFKEVKFAKLREENPVRILELAVRRMLPKNRLAKGRMARLKLFADDKHPYGDKVKEQESKSVKEK